MIHAIVRILIWLIIPMVIAILLTAIAKKVFGNELYGLPIAFAAIGFVVGFIIDTTYKFWSER